MNTWNVTEMSPWRNRLARQTVNLKVVSSILTGDDDFTSISSLLNITEIYYSNVHCHLVTPVDFLDVCNHSTKFRPIFR